MSDFGSDGRIGNKWNGATRTIAFGRMQPDGHFHTFLSAADGSNERRVTFSAWRDDRHQFPSSWHPSGAYLAMLVEKNDHEGSSLDAIPGYGAYTDYWLVTPDGTQAWKLYDLPAGYDHAITHAAFSPDGSKFIWSERIRAPQIFDPNLFAGSYVFNVADFVPTPAPHLATCFASNQEMSNRAEKSSRSPPTTRRSRSTVPTSPRISLRHHRIYTMNTDTGVISELTTESWAQGPTFTPDGKSIVYSTGAGADIFPGQLQGADLWIMNVDGSNKRRLTFMNVTGDPQSVNQIRLAGSPRLRATPTFSPM